MATRTALLLAVSAGTLVSAAAGGAQTSDSARLVRARASALDVVGTPIARNNAPPIAQSAAPVASPSSLAAAGQPLDPSGSYSAAQLDNLVASIALYPDALLAQVLVAATFPDQIDDAARYVRASGTDGIDDQPWDVSVKSVAHYPSALNTLADKLDWTTALGRAYANQSSDVMQAVQRLRRMADGQGNLVSNSQQQIVREQDNYLIVPVQPRVVYVPTYDPVVIYTRPVFTVGHVGRYWSWGVGFPIGSWLSYDCDWGTRVVYYNGWRDPYLAYGGGWRVRSRPVIHITNVYVNPRYRTVYVNRDVSRRVIDYHAIDRYPRVHRDTYFDVARRDEPRTAVPRSAQPRGDDRRWSSNESVARATPDGYTRDRSDNSSMSRSRSSMPSPRIERTPRSNDGTIAPRSESPRAASPRQESPRQESSRSESPRGNGSRGEAGRSTRGEARSESVSRAPRGDGESRSARPRERGPRND